MRLTPKQVIEICEVILNFRTEENKNDWFCLKQHMQNLAVQLMHKNFKDNITVDEIKEKVYKRFCNALIIPGKPYGHIAASSNSEPATQKVLKSSHNAGTEGKKGNATNELIMCANEPKDNWLSFRLSTYEGNKEVDEMFINQLIVFNYKFVVKPNQYGETFGVSINKDGQTFIIVKLSIENMIKSNHTIVDCVSFLRDNKIHVYQILEEVEPDGDRVFTLYIKVDENKQLIYTTLLTFNLDDNMGITNPQTIKKDILKDCLTSIITIDTTNGINVSSEPFLDRNDEYNDHEDNYFRDIVLYGIPADLARYLKIENNPFYFLSSTNLDDHFDIIQPFYEEFKAYCTLTETMKYNKVNPTRSCFYKYTLTLYPLCVSPKRVKYMLFKMFFSTPEIKRIYLNYDEGLNLSGFTLETTEGFDHSLSYFTDNSRFVYNILFDMIDSSDAKNMISIMEDHKQAISIAEITTASVRTMFKLFGITAARHFAYRRWVDLVSPNGEVPQMFIEILLAYSYEQYERPFGIVRSADKSRNPLTLGAEGSIMQQIIAGSLRANKYYITDNITQNLTGSQSGVFGLNFVRTLCNTELGAEILREHNMPMSNQITSKSPIFLRMLHEKSRYKEPVE